MDIAQLQDTLARLGVLSTPLKTLHDFAVELAPTLDDRETKVEAQFPVYVLPIPREDALSTWEKLYALIPRTEAYPVILGGKDSLLVHFRQWEYAASPLDSLKQAEAIDARQWLDQKWARYADFDEEINLNDLIGEWEGRVYDPRADFRVNLELLLFLPSDDPVQYIGFVGTSVSWQVPAYLAFGDWNACPSPAEHVALHRSWYEQYRTEIVAVKSDTMICRVGVHVTEKDQVMALARDQMMYCGDIVMQGAGTIAALAAELLSLQVWYFWWD